MRRAALGIAALVLPGFGPQTAAVTVPSNHGKPLDVALERLHAAGLRASFPAASTPCGSGLPWVNVQSPRAPASVRYGTAVTIKFGFSPIPSPGFPARHPRWTTVPNLVGLEYRDAESKLHAIWPCVHVRAANGTPAFHLVVVAQSLAPGTRVRAYGVRVGRAFRPTTIRLIVAAR